MQVIALPNIRRKPREAFRKEARATGGGNRQNRNQLSPNESQQSIFF